MKKFLLIACLILFQTAVFAQYNQTGHYGDTIRATIHPEPGWRFLGWYQADVLISTSPDLVYIIRGDANVVAKLEKITFKLEIFIIPPGSATISGIGDYLPGDWATIKIKPSPMFKIDNIKDSKGLHYTENDLKFQMTEDKILYASLALHWWMYIIIATLLAIVIYIGNRLHWFKKFLDETFK